MFSISSNQIIIRCSINVNVYYALPFRNCPCLVQHMYRWIGNILCSAHWHNWNTHCPWTKRYERVNFGQLGEAIISTTSIYLIRSPNIPSSIQAGMDQIRGIKRWTAAGADNEGDCRHSFIPDTMTGANLRAGVPSSTDETNMPPFRVGQSKHLEGCRLFNSGGHVGITRPECQVFCDIHSSAQ
jgi:hypothetical protein